MTRRAGAGLLISDLCFTSDISVCLREFLTGFHKRKLAKAEAAKRKAVEREKQERLEARRDVCGCLLFDGSCLGIFSNGVC
jgi:hypothetical protein